MNVLSASQAIPNQLQETKEQLLLSHHATLGETRNLDAVLEFNSSMRPGSRLHETSLPASYIEDDQKAVLEAEQRDMKETIKSQELSLIELGEQHHKALASIRTLRKENGQLKRILGTVKEITNLEDDSRHELDSSPVAQEDAVLGKVLAKQDSSSAMSTSSSSSSEADSSEPSSSSDSESDSASDSSSSASSSSVEEMSSKVPLPEKSSNGHIQKDSSGSSSSSKKGIPFQGTHSTATRNDRRKRQRTLQRLIDAGKLPEGSNFKALEQYQSAYQYADQPTLAGLQSKALVIGTSTPSAVWDYPDEPEPGWEQRLVVKEIECEQEPEETAIPVQQYQEEVERGRKRKRMDEQGTETGRTLAASNASLQTQEVVFDADMYGDAPIVTNGIAPIIHDQDDLEDGEVEDSITLNKPGTSGDSVIQPIDIHSELPPLPRNLDSMPRLELTSALLSKPGAVIAFKYMEMRNYAPAFSDYKTARILQVQGETLILDLAIRDRDEPLYDYEGERVPGPFDVEDEHGEVIAGRLEIHRGELMEPVLISQ